MSRFCHTLKSFALLACLTFLLFSSVGCFGDSVVGPSDSDVEDVSSNSNDGPDTSKSGSDVGG